MTSLLNKLDDPLRSEIENIIASGKLPHAIILQGENQKLVDLTALILIQSAVCTENNGPCGRCSGCLKAEKEIHPDVYTLAGSTASGNISVNDIRNLCSDTYIVPNEAPSKVYVIPESHKMNVQSQNALLKSLEEPVQQTLYILKCKTAHTLLETIRSRCVIIKIPAGADSEQSAEVDQAVRLAEDIADAVCMNTEYNLLALTGRLSIDREKTKLTIIHLNKIFFNACRFSLKSEAEGNAELYKKLVRQIKINKLYSMKMVVQEAYDSLDRNVNLNLLSVWLCSKLREIKNSEI